MNLPSVVHIPVLARGPEVRLRERHGRLAALAVAEQEVGECLARLRIRQALGRVRLEQERAAGKLVADLIVPVVADLEAYAE